MRKDNKNSNIVINAQNLLTDTFYLFLELLGHPISQRPFRGQNIGIMMHN